MLSSWGIAFDGVDVEKEPARWDDLKQRNIPGLPATILGDRFVFGWNPKGLGDLVGVEYDPGKRLTPDELRAKLDAILTANQRILRQIPEGKLGMKHPERDRTVKDLGFHVFRVGLAFRDCLEQGQFLASWFAENAKPDMKDGDSVARWGQEVRQRLQEWFARPGWCEGTANTYYGTQPVLDLMERTTWHAAQHLRQMYWFLDQMGIQPEGKLTDADLAGLPFPREVWA